MHLSSAARTAAIALCLPSLGATPFDCETQPDRPVWLRAIGAVERQLSRSSRHDIVNGGPDAPFLAPDMIAGELSAYAKDLGYESVRNDGSEMLLVPMGGTAVPLAVGEPLTAAQPAGTRLRLVGQAMNRLRFNTEKIVAFAPIDARARTFSAANAHAASHLARLAYLDPSTVKAQLGEWGFDTETFRWLEDATTDTQGFVVADKNGVIVTVFRGTASMRDVKTDADAAKVTAAWAPTARPIEVHRGFNGSLESVWPAWSTAVDAAKRTVTARGQTPNYLFAGHSLGAALTNLAALRSLREGRIEAARTQVYTNGSPRAGDEAFRDAFFPLAERSFRMVNTSSMLTDMITRVPLKAMGFRHAGNLVLLSDGEPQIIPWTDGSSRGALESAGAEERPILDPEDEELAGMSREQMEREFARAAGLAPEPEGTSTRGLSVPGAWLHFMGTYLDRSGRGVATP